MKILGIETSCDETAVSLIEVDDNTRTLKILGNTVHSQIEQHVPYGGVFPMLAKREHEKNLPLVLAKTLDEAGENAENIDAIAVTVGPGLEPALWTGIVFAQELSKEWNLPIIPCNHMEGHILTALIKKSDDEKTGSEYNLVDKDVSFPALSLLISGGHTQIVLIENIGSYKIVGDTRDDAIGECFDKVARTIGLSYPGGPKISKLAAEGREEDLSSPEALPRPMIDTDDLDMSFSGLKTAVLYMVKRLKEKNIEIDEDMRRGISREVEDAITDVVISKMRKAAEKYAVQTVIVGGGVIANKNIRENLEMLADECGLNLLLPQFDHATDNALMIAISGYFNQTKAVSFDTKLTAKGTLPLGPRD